MEILTVGELIEKLKRMPKSANVFMITDRTDANWDEDNAVYNRVHGIKYVTKETIYPNDGLTDDIEINILLEIGGGHMTKEEVLKLEIEERIE